MQQWEFYSLIHLCPFILSLVFTEDALRENWYLPQKKILSSRPASFRRADGKVGTLSADDTAQWTCYVSSVGTRQKCWLFVNPCLPGDRLVGIYLTVSRKYHSKTKNGFKYYWSVNFPRRKLMRSANSAGARAGGPDPRLVSRRSVNVIWRYTISQYVVYL